MQLCKRQSYILIKQKKDVCNSVQSHIMEIKLTGNAYQFVRVDIMEINHGEDALYVYQLAKLALENINAQVVFLVIS